MKLQTKFMSALLIFASLSAAAILYFSREAVDRILIDAAADRGLLAVNDLAAVAAAGMEKRDEKTLLPLLIEAHQRAHASYAMALDPSGTVLAHTNIVEWRKHYSDAATREALARETPGFDVFRAEGKRILEVSAPVWSVSRGEDFIFAQSKGGKTRVGALRIGIPLKEEDTTRSRILRKIAYILLIALAFTLGLNFIFVHNVLGPIMLLTRETDRIGAGERNSHVPIVTSDEVGHLAASFNKMVDNLRNTTVSKEFIDNIISNMADGLLVLEPDGKIRIANRAAADLLGLPHSELIGRPVASLLERNARSPDSGSGFEWLLREGSVREYETSLKTRNGEEITVIFASSLVKNKEGKTEAIVLLAKDISERKKMESILMQSEKLSAVGQLAAGVAHEINNPLGIILGFAQSAAKKIKDGDPLILPVKSIEREATRCKNLVKNLLAFSRQNKPRMEELDLNATVDDTLSIVEAQARVKTVEIVKELGRVGPLLGDKNQIQQVIINLCNNAIDAMPQGGKIILRTRGSGDGEIILEVEDTGSGIPKDIQDKIFNPFFTTKEVGKGTGLGLSLVYEIVQRHKATIEVESEPGKGAVFTVSFPASAGVRAE